MVHLPQEIKARMTDIISGLAGYSTRTRSLKEIFPRTCLNIKNKTFITMHRKSLKAGT